MKRIGAIICLVAVTLTITQGQDSLEWTELPQIPDEQGVAGPYTGIDGGTLIVAGGANFPKPVWESDKQWHATVYGLPLGEDGAKWETLGELPRPLGYGACISVPEGVLCLGGNDAEKVYDSVFLLSVDDGSIRIDESLPPLPQPLCYSAAAMIGSHIYVAGGQTGFGLETAQKNVWRLDWSKRGGEGFEWEMLETWPGAARAFSCVVAQDDRLFVIGGRHLDEEGETEFLADVFAFDPARSEWSQQSEIPKPMAAGTAVAMGHDRIFLLAGADGSLFKSADELKDDHPGFPKAIWVYNTAADNWSKGGEMPANQVTTHAVKHGEFAVIASGEVRPRVRTPAVWRIETVSAESASAALFAEAGARLTRDGEGHVIKLFSGGRPPHSVVDLQKIAAMTKLEELALNAPAAGNSEWEFLHDLPNLKKLTIWHGHHFSDLTPFSNLSIEALTVGGCMGIRDLNKDNPRNQRDAVLTLTNLPNLTFLNLYHSPLAPADEHLAHIVENFPKLTELRLDFKAPRGFETTTTPEGLTKLQSLPLEILSLENIHDFTTDHMAAVSGIETLKHLLIDARKNPFETAPLVDAVKRARPELDIQVAGEGAKGPPRPAKTR